MRTLLAMTAAVVVLCSSAGAQMVSDPWMRGASSVATNDDATAVFLNPAGLGLLDETNTYSALSIAGEDVSSVRVGFKMGPLGAGFHREYVWKPMEDAGFRPSGDAVDTYIMGMAFGDARKWSIGFDHRWLRAQYGAEEKATTWDVGLIIRPTNYLSIGGVVRNLSEPQFSAGTLAPPSDGGCADCETRMTYTAGVAVRPLGSRLTLMADASMPRDAEIEDAVVTAGAETEIMNGLLLRGSIQTYPEGDDRDEEVSVGLWLNTLHVGAGASLRTFDPAVDDIMTYGLSTSTERMRTVVKGQNGVAEIEIGGKLSDDDSGWSLLGDPTTSTRRIARDIRRAAEDSSIECILLRIRPIAPGFIGGPPALAQEIRDEVVRAREEHGKKVLAYLEYGATAADYHIASAADVVMMNPSAMIEGISNFTTVMRYTGTTEKLGIEWDYMSAGKYKSTFHSIGAGPLTDEQRVEVQGLVDDVYTEIVDAVAAGRGLSREQAETACDGRMLTGPQAVEAGLVDSLVFWDDAKAAAVRLAGGSPPDEPDGIATVDVSGWREKAYDWNYGPMIAVVGAYGSIDVGKGGSDPIQGGESIGSETLVAALARARRDPRVKAVILRVDSGGGSALASDIIWNETMRVAGKKPFIVSMADIAGSGGYYIACAAERIFVDPLTITGSIGVVAMKPSFAGLYEKIGTTHETFKRGKYADAWSTTRRATDDELAMAQGLIEWNYDEFVGKVASGRKLTEERVRELAEGKVYTGNQAVEVGLVDGIGGLSEAIDYACERVGVERDRATIAYFRPRPSFLDQVLKETSAKLGLSRLFDLGAVRPQDMVQFRMTTDILGD
jgi:protease IV